MKVRAYKKRDLPKDTPGRFRNFNQRTAKDDLMRFKCGAVWPISRFLQVDTSGAFADFATRNNEDIFTILSADTSGRFDKKTAPNSTALLRCSTMAAVSCSKMLDSLP